LESTSASDSERTQSARSQRWYTKQEQLISFLTHSDEVLPPLVFPIKSDAVKVEICSSMTIPFEVELHEERIHHNWVRPRFLKALASVAGNLLYDDKIPHGSSTKRRSKRSDRGRIDRSLRERALTPDQTQRNNQGINMHQSSHHSHWLSKMTTFPQDGLMSSVHVPGCKQLPTVVRMVQLDQDTHARRITCGKDAYQRHS